MTATVDLVLRAQRGDRDAFARLVADQIDRLYATAYLILGSSESGRDATQEAMLAAWRGLPDCRRSAPATSRLIHLVEAPELTHAPPDVAGRRAS